MRRLIQPNRFGRIIAAKIFGIPRHSSICRTSFPCGAQIGADTLRPRLLMYGAGAGTRTAYDHVGVATIGEWNVLHDTE